MNKVVGPQTYAGEHLPCDPAVRTMVLAVTEAFTAGRVDEGTRLMERAIELDVSWELLTNAVRQGLEAPYSRTPMSVAPVHAGA